MHDTSPDAQRKYYELLREISPRRRLEMCVSLSECVRQLALAGIREAAGGVSLSEAELRWRLAERLYGREVAVRVFQAPKE